MILIQVPSDGLAELDFTKLVGLHIPEPDKGFRLGVNNTVAIAFVDEQEAIDYAHYVDEYFESLNDQDSEDFLAASDIIKAIGDDVFVQAYIFS